ncbi:MAG: hypothetical protein CL484_00590 [Acidobacteria bacterium]|nr:hypothetical protein [Acidobacteriota bacterium]
MDTHITLDDLMHQTMTLEAAVKEGGIELAHERLAQTLAEISRDKDIAAYFGDDGAIGMAAKGDDPKGFFRAFRDRMRGRICDDDSSFRELVAMQTAASATAVLVLLQDQLGLPPEITPVLVPIAVMISQAGIDAFCDWTKPG